MKKKVLAVLLSATMLATVLAGCGKSSDAPSEEKAVEEDASGGVLQRIAAALIRLMRLVRRKVPENPKAAVF